MCSCNNSLHVNRLSVVTLRCVALPTAWNCVSTEVRGGLDNV